MYGDVLYGDKTYGDVTYGDISSLYRIFHCRNTKQPQCTVYAVPHTLSPLDPQRTDKAHNIST
jgi:hypothetical protein